MQESQISITPEFLKLIAEIDEFKGKWEALKHISPECLHRLRREPLPETSEAFCYLAMIRRMLKRLAAASV